MPPTDERSPFDFGSALAIGVSLGMIFGLLLDNIALGLVTGLMLATLANAYHQKRLQRSGANLALAISLGALFFVSALWILSAMGIF